MKVHPIHLDKRNSRPDSAALVISIDNFVTTHDRCNPNDRRIALRLLELLHGELYRREREHYPEWVDVGGEGGEG